MIKILSKDFFNQPTLRVAKKLLGKFLVRRLGGKEIAVMITETEAYDGPKDLASHASRGLTSRTRVMFGQYFIYGMHWLVNIVTGKKSYPAAVLIRGGIFLKKNGDRIKINGPAKLTKFLKIDGKFNGRPAKRDAGLWFENRGIKIKHSQIQRKKRVGVDYAGSWAKKLYNVQIK